MAQLGNTKFTQATKDMATANLKSGQHLRPSKYGSWASPRVPWALLGTKEIAGALAADIVHGAAPAHKWSGQLWVAFGSRTLESTTTEERNSELNQTTYGLGTAHSKWD